MTYIFIIYYIHCVDKEAIKLYIRILFNLIKFVDDITWSDQFGMNESR